MPEVGAVLRTKDENYKEILPNLQECVLQYVLEKYKKWVYLDPLIRKLEDVDQSRTDAIAPTGTGTRAPT